MTAYVGGDEAALRRLFERHFPRIQKIARRALGNDEDARDVAQEAFVRLHRARSDFRTGASVRRWLYTIAYNLIRDRLRKSRRVRVTELDEEQLGDVGAVERHLQAELVRALVDELQPEDRKLVIERWFEQHSFKELASARGAAEGTVRVRAHRVLRRLGKLLSQSGVTKADV